MRIKVKDIAKDMNLSPATVSMALNNRPGISLQTRQRVQEYVQTLERKNGRSYQLGEYRIKFIVYQKNGQKEGASPYFSQIFSELIAVIEQEIRSRGYKFSVIYLNSENFYEKIEEIKKTDGLLVLATEMIEEQLKAIADKHVPTVIVDNFCEDLNFDFVTVNNNQGVFLALQSLWQKGHREIGYLHVCKNSNNFTERYYAFLRYAEMLGIVESKKSIYEINTENIYDELKSIMHPRELPRAFFADNDIVAASALRLFREWGFSIPGDISIIGFDNMSFSKMLDPPLTTIQISKKQMGQLAVERLLKQLKDGKENVRIEIAAHLIERESVAQSAVPLNI